MGTSNHHMIIHPPMDACIQTYYEYYNHQNSDKLLQCMYKYYVARGNGRHGNLSGMGQS